MLVVVIISLTVITEQTEQTSTGLQGWIIRSVNRIMASRNGPACQTVITVAIRLAMTVSYTKPQQTRHVDPMLG